MKNPKPKLTPEDYLARHKALAAMPITPEEKYRWSGMLQQTWSAIGDDAEQLGCRLTKAVIIELTLDANRPETYGGMTREEYSALCAASHTPAAKKWLRQILNF